MPKKITKTKKSPKDHAVRITFLIMGVFLFLVSLTVLLQNPQEQCANSISCLDNLTGKKEADNEGEFMGNRVTAKNLPEAVAYVQKETTAVLGDTTQEYKRIYVDLTNQRLYAYEGGNKVHDFAVSTGKWGATPTGNFRIWIWLRYTRMAGGNKALGTYYNLPNVPYTMYFYKGYGLHGAYWHNNFGHPMSHGCVNMKIEEAGTIYNWSNPSAGNIAYPSSTNPGTQVIIYGVTPNS